MIHTTSCNDIFILFNASKLIYFSGKCWNINYGLKSTHVETPGAIFKKKTQGLELQSIIIIENHYGCKKKSDLIYIKSQNRDN